LQDALDRNRHEFVLDWACYFFEPDDPAFISVNPIASPVMAMMAMTGLLQLSQSIYDRTLQQGKAALLHSTRHYGPFIFYHVINGNLPPLLNQAGRYVGLEICPSPETIRKEITESCSVTIS
jgi:hypothetical protein